MRDACSEHDLLLSLRFAGSGLDCVVRRRVYDLGLCRHVRGCRAGLHSRRNTPPYVLTSIAPDCAPVITGNRPPRRAVAAITVVGLGASSPPSSSCSDERAASSKAKNHLVRPTLRRHACQQIVCFDVLRLTSTRLPTRWTLSGSAGLMQGWTSSASLRCGMKMLKTFRFVDCALRVCSCWSGLIPFGLGRGPTTYPIKITAEWRWSHLPPSSLQSSMSRLNLSPSRISSPG